jgi:hypothetical protein
MEGFWMAINDAMLKKGYMPLVSGDLIGIGWQGEELKDFWMWNRRLTEYEGGVKRICTVKVVTLREAALHYWRDGWVPLKPVTGDFLRRMERALRGHAGLKREGVVVPDTEFLQMPEEIPPEQMGPEVRKYLGLDVAKEETLSRKGSLSGGLLKSYKRHKAV